MMPSTEVSAEVNNTIKYACLLVEDEPLGIELMVGYIRKRNDLTLAHIITECRELQEYLACPVRIDIVFMNLKVVGGHTDHMVNAIRNKFKARVAIVSGYPEQVFKKWGDFSGDFILQKPFSYDSFDLCVNQLLKTVH